MTKKYGKTLFLNNYEHCDTNQAQNRKTNMKRLTPRDKQLIHGRPRIPPKEAKS